MYSRWVVRTTLHELTVRMQNMLASTRQERRGLSVFLLTALVLSVGCGESGARAESIGERPDQSAVRVTAGESDQEVVIRFAIEVASNVAGPIYVLINDENDQPGWIRAFRGADRVYFRERCDIEDCARRAIVCGAAMPMIKNIASQAQIGLTEFIWDGTTSVVDTVSGCETRQPALSGNFIARFCYSREAEFEGDSDLALGVPGRLVRPTCVEKPFTLLDREVVLRF